MAGRVVRHDSRLRSAATQKILTFGALIGLFIVFTLASPYFLTFDNVMGILLATTVNGVLALGATFVIITAGIDLSVGTVMTLSAVMAAEFVTNWGLPVYLGLLGGVLTGALAGFANGITISKMKVPPFVATLGVMMAAKGLSLVIAHSKPIYFAQDSIVRGLTMDSVVGLVIPGLDIPNAIFYLFGAAIIASLILGKTILGRYAFAIGSNEEATRLSGVNVDFWKTAVYTLCGVFSGLGGVIIASRLNSAQPALGSGYELDAIAAVVIGGTSLSGGEGTILGTVIGAFIMSVLTNGLRILSVAQEWQLVVTGGIVIVAVYADMLRRRQQQGRMRLEGGDQAVALPPGPEREQQADVSAGG
ncbi:MAG TPA: ABC transporter permease [bacterium]|nr:ABC transporter permease [bacterium]